MKLKIPGATERLEPPISPDSLVEEDEFELSVPDFEGTFFIRPGAWTCQPPRESEPDFDDRQRQGYRPPSQAGPGNDIHAGSPSLQKAPTRGPASLARSFLESSHKLRSIKPAPWECLTKQKTRARHATFAPVPANNEWYGRSARHTVARNRKFASIFLQRRVTRELCWSATAVRTPLGS